MHRRSARFDASGPWTLNTGTSTTRASLSISETKGIRKQLDIGKFREIIIRVKYRLCMQSGFSSKDSLSAPSNYGGSVFGEDEVLLSPLVLQDDF